MLTHRLSEFRVVTFQVLGSCEELAPLRAALSPGLRCESGAHLKAHESLPYSNRSSYAGKKVPRSLFLFGVDCVSEEEEAQVPGACSVRARR